MRLYDNLRVYDVGGQHLLLNTGGQKADMTVAFGINEPAAWLIRRAADNDFTENDLVEWLCGEYDVDEDTARTDVESLLKVLKEHGLIVED